ncbi:MAG: hypothetical protein HYX20_03615 [Candidatus Yanofskybacteria bacterium]|nr:hypothetical protein [Candidatus Yanofskybacteria bacterium]
MTKRQQIAALLKEGLNYKEIAERIRSSYQYVANIAMDLRHPSCLSASISKFRQKYPERRREWLKKNPEIKSKERKKILDFHQNITRPLAKNHWQRWTIKEIEFLEQHGKSMSIHELAIELGRTYMAVQMAANRFDIDLRGNKVGAGAAMFVGSYRNQ